MTFRQGTEEYYKKFLELQEKLRKSEEERLKLEMKFNEMMQVTREEEQLYYRKLRSQYKQFLEENRKRQDRNERILRLLERIESRATMLEAKTHRFQLLRRQYQSFLKRTCSQKLQEIKENDTKNIQKSVYKTNTSSDMYPNSVYQNEKKEDILKKYLEDMENRSITGNASTIADDIMNSIYSRKHFHKEDEYIPKGSSETSLKPTLRFKDDEENICGKKVKSLNKLDLQRNKDKYDSSSEDDFNSDKYYREKEHRLSKRPNGAPTQMDNISNYKDGTQLENLSLIYKQNGNDNLIDRETLNETEYYPDSRLSLKQEHDTIKDFDVLNVGIEKSFNKKVQYKLGDEESNIVGNSDILPENVKLKVVDTYEKENNEPSEKELKTENKGNELHENPITPKVFSVHKRDNNLKDTDAKTDKEERCEGLNYGTNEKIINKFEEKPLENRGSDEHKEENIDIFGKKIQIDYKLNENENKDKLVTKEEVSNNRIIEEDKEAKILSEDIPNIDNKKHTIDQTNESNNINEDLIVEEVKAVEDVTTNEVESINVINKSDNLDILNIDKEQKKSEDNSLKETCLKSYENEVPIIPGPDVKPVDNDASVNSIKYKPGDSNEQAVLNDQPNIEFGPNKETMQYEQHNDQIEFDEYGQPIRYDQNGQQIHYDENGQKNEYDQNGQPVHYDENGQLVQLDAHRQEINYDENGQQIQYDENGQEIQNDENGKQMEYDENGQQIQYDENGQKIQYDEHGQQIHYDENGQQIHYDENGQQIQYDENGQEIQYDENGQQIHYDENFQQIQYDENGQEIQYDQNGQQIQYDENGQKIQYDEHSQQIHYDENGQQIHYDENGQEMQYSQSEQQVQYDENGQPHQYNENDQQILYDENDQQIYYDESGQQIIYDENGLPTPYNSKTQYDEPGQPIEYNANNDHQLSYGDNKQFDSNRQQIQYNENINYTEQQDISNTKINNSETTSNGQGTNITPSKDPVNYEQGNTSNLIDEQYEMDKTEKSMLESSQKVFPEAKDSNKANVMDLLETDSESIKQDTKISNDSDFDFSNN